MPPLHIDYSLNCVPERGTYCTSTGPDETCQGLRTERENCQKTTGDKTTGDRQPVCKSLIINANYPPVTTLVQVSVFGVQAAVKTHSCHPNRCSSIPGCQLHPRDHT